MEEPTYLGSTPNGPLRQGEVISTIVQHIVIEYPPGDEQRPRVREKKHPLVIVLSQDCDLTQDFMSRADNSVDSRQTLHNILLCEVENSEVMKNKADQVARGSDIWKRILQNKDERFQYLRAIPKELDALGKGVDPLIADFKRTFTLPTETLYGQLNGAANRRACLNSPYREHLSTRLAYFLARVALSREHHP